MIQFGLQEDQTRRVLNDLHVTVFSQRDRLGDELLHPLDIRLREEAISAEDLSDALALPPLDRAAPLEVALFALRV